MFEEFNEPKKSEKETNGSNLLIFLSILVFIGFLAGKTLWQSLFTIIGVYGLCFLLVGAVIGLIYLFDK